MHCACIKATQNYSLFSAKFNDAPNPPVFKDYTVPTDCTVNVLGYFFTTESDMRAFVRFPRCIMVDGTFKTNDEQLILIIMVGLNAVGKSIPALYGYCEHETDRAANFSVRALRVVYGKHLAHITICLSDGGPALVKAWTTAIECCLIGFMAMVIQRLCFWYVASSN